MNRNSFASYWTTRRLHLKQPTYAQPCCQRVLHDTRRDPPSTQFSNLQLLALPPAIDTDNRRDDGLVVFRRQHGARGADREGHQ